MTGTRKWNRTEQMELTEIIMPAITAVIGGAAGWGAKVKAAKSEAVQAVENVQASLQKHIEFTDDQFDKLRSQLAESRAAEEDCYKKHKVAMERIDELDHGIRAMMKAPDKPKRNGN